MTSTITIQYCDDSTSTRIYNTNTRADYEQFFYDLAEIYCFADCSDERVLSARYNDEDVYYCGWRPGMLYEFKNRKGEIVYSNRFPHWEH